MTVVDPLASMRVDFHCYEVHRECSVFFNVPGTRAWAKAWFNDREVGEPAVPIPLSVADAWCTDGITKDEMLSRYYPAMMKVCREAVEKTRQESL